MIVVTSAEMRALDEWTIAHGTPGHVLMERAGRGATRVLRARLKPRGPVLVVCGKGNNGGDGFVVARLLRRARVPVEVWLVARENEVRGDATRMLAAWKKVRGATHAVCNTADVARLRARLGRSGAIVDALFGTGLNSPVEGIAGEVIAAVNASGAPVLAVDMPSGLSADTGQPLGVTVRATATATFGFAKVGHTIHPGLELSGALEVIDIGIPRAGVEAIAPRTELLEARALGAALVPRPRDAHKGGFGHVLVIAGGRGKSGAALLAATAVLRAGAGLATLALPATLQPVLDGWVPELMTEALPDAGDGTSTLADGAALRRLLGGRAAVVCGPGLGVSAGTRQLVAALLQAATVPVVLDADGINVVAGSASLRERHAPTIVTPHPGEMARLAGTDTAAVQGDRLAAARRLAHDQAVIVVLKGARTIVAHPDGRAAINPTGNPGMATGGMGDVLAGAIGGLLAQGLEPFTAARLGVFAHGAAGDRVARQRGERGLLARDVLEAFPNALAELAGGGQGGRGRS